MVQDTIECDRQLELGSTAKEDTWPHTKAVVANTCTSSADKPVHTPFGVRVQFTADLKGTHTHGPVQTAAHRMIIWKLYAHTYVYTSNVYSTPCQ